MLDEIIDPDCSACEQAQKDYTELDKVAGDLAILVVRLTRALRKAAPENDLTEKAMDYLRRNGFECQPLRKTKEIK